MALSNYYDTNFGPGNNYLQRMEWWGTQNYAGNYTDIRVKVSMYSNSTWSMQTSALKYGTVYVWNHNRGSEQQSYSLNRYGVSTNGGTWVTLGDQTMRINHNDDGSCLAEIICDFNYDVTINGVYCGRVDCGGGYWIDSIPRGMMWINHLGTWKKGRMWINHLGTWKQANGVWVNQLGTWRRGI